MPMRRLPNQPRQPLLTAAQWHVPKVLAVELEKVEGVQRGLADGAAAAGAIPAIAGTVGETDPIFAAIAKHRAAVVAYSEYTTLQLTTSTA
jgi:hypothetical protein